MSLCDLLASAGPRFKARFLQDHHPSVAEVVTDFRERSANVGGPFEIVGSGPEAMGSGLKFAVLKIEDGDGVSFYWDSREYILTNWSTILKSSCDECAQVRCSDSPGLRW